MRGYGRFSTTRAVIILLAGKLDFSKVSQFASESTRFSKEPDLFYEQRILSVDEHSDDKALSTDKPGDRIETDRRL